MIKYKTYLLACFFSIPFIGFSQKHEKEPEYNYISVGVNYSTNTFGSFAEKAFSTVEVGRSFGIFDLGLMGGRLTLSQIDSSWFTELLPTINVFSKGRFSEALTLGAGFIFHAKNNFLTEITNSINFSPSNQVSIAISEGNYFLDGRRSTAKSQYIGLSVTYNFISPGSKTNVLKKKSLLE